MGGIFNFQTHNAFMIQSSTFKYFCEPFKNGVFCRFIFQALLFIPLLITVIYNAKRIDFEEDEISSSEFKFNANPIEIIFVTMYVMSLCVSPCILRCLYRS